MVWSQFHLPPKKTRRKHLTMCIPNSKAHLLQLKRNSFHRNSYSGTIWNRKCFILIFLIPERLLDRIARIWGGNSLREAGTLRALSFSVFKGDGKKLLSPGTDQRSYVFFFSEWVLKSPTFVLCMTLNVLKIPDTCGLLQGQAWTSWVRPCDEFF